MSLLTNDHKKAYEEDGYLFVRELFTQEEIGLLHETAANDHALDQASSSRDDGAGASVRLSLWNHPGDGIYGMFARCRRLIDALEDLLGDEVYHYHSKMILKDAKTGGAWAWHQDYGSKRAPDTRSLQRHDRRRSGHRGERLLASFARITQSGSHQPRINWRPGWSRHGIRKSRYGAIPSRPLPPFARGRRFLPSQFAALLSRQSIR